MPKKGLIASWTNHVAFKDFLVSPRWIVSFVQRGKMTHEDAKKVIVFSFLEGGAAKAIYQKSLFFTDTHFYHILDMSCSQNVLPAKVKLLFPKKNKSQARGADNHETLWLAHYFLGNNEKRGIGAATAPRNGCLKFSFLPREKRLVCPQGSFWNN